MFPITGEFNGKGIRLMQMMTKQFLNKRGKSKRKHILLVQQKTIANIGSHSYLGLNDTKVNKIGFPVLQSLEDWVGDEDLLIGIVCDNIQTFHMPALRAQNIFCQCI